MTRAVPAVSRSGRTSSNRLTAKAIILIVAMLVAVALAGAYVTVADSSLWLIAPGVILAVLVFRHPFVGLCLMLASMPITNYLPRVPFASTLTAGIGVLTFGAYIIQILLRRRPMLHLKSRTYFWIFGFAVVLLLSLLLDAEGLSRPAQMTKMFTYLQLFFLVIVVEQLVISHRHIEWLMITWISAMAGVQIVALLNFDFSVVGRLNRLAGLLDNANGLAYYSAVSVWFTAYFLLRERRARQRVLLLLLLTLNVVSILLSDSRTALLALGLSIAYFVWLERRQLRRVLAPVGFVVIVVAILASQLNYGGALADTQQAFYDLIIGQNVDLAQNSGIARIDLWQAWLHAYEPSPIFGLGTGVTESRYEYSSAISNVPHNSFISVLVENGLVGLFFFVGLMIRAWRNLSPRLYPADESVLGLHRAWQLIWIVLIVTSLAGSLEYEKLVWLMIGISVALSANEFVPAVNSDDR